MKKKTLLLLPFFVLSSCGNNPNSGSISGSSSGSSSIDESISYSEPPIPSWSVDAPPEAKVSDFTLDYHDDWKGYYVSDYKGSMESFQIPAAGQGDHGVAPIVGISSFAFAKRTGVKRIALHDNLRRIEPSAFAESGLEELYVTSGLVDVSVSSFEGTKLKIHGYGGVWFLPGLDFEYKYAYGVKDDTETAVLPEGCVGICKGAFKDYKKNIVFPTTLACLPAGWGGKAAAQNAYFAGGLSHFRYAGNRAFENVLRLKSVRIGEDAIKIENYAFYLIPLLETAVVSPKAELGEGAFYSCPRLQVYVAGSKDAVEEKWPLGWVSADRTPVYGVKMDYEPVVVDGFEVHAVSSSSDAQVVAYRGKSQDVTLPLTLKVNSKNYDVTFAKGAFAGSAAVNVTLGFANIVDGTFTGSSIARISLLASYKKTDSAASTFSVNYLPTTLKTFEVAASNTDFSVSNDTLFDRAYETLYRCPPGKEGKSYMVTSTAKAIGPCAFAGAKEITDVYCGKNSNFNFATSSFKDNMTIHYQGTVADWITNGLGANVGHWKVDLGKTSISVPSSISKLPSYALSNLASVTSITIPSSITVIPYGAFSGCTSLTSITFPDNLTEIEDGTFRYCTSLRKVIIPASVTSISWVNGPFAGIKDLTVYFRASSRPKGWNGYANDESYSPVKFVYGYKGS